MILQHDYGLELGLIACRHILMASHHGSSILRIDVWILKNTYTEYVGEKAYGRLFESLPRTLFSVFFFPQFICLQAYGIVRCASQLVNPGFEAFESFLGRGFCLHAPRSSTVLIDFIVIIDNTPVGADYTFIVILVPEEFLDDIVAESVADILSGRILIIGNRVIRHHGRRHLRSVAEIECSIDKWNEILCQIVSRIDGIFSCAEMGVTAAFASSSSRPVLDHAVDGIHAPSVFASRSCLECIAVFTHNVSVQFRTFAECAVEPSPARVGGKVGLWRQCCGDTECTVFRRYYFAMSACYHRIESGGHSYFTRPK